MFRLNRNERSHWSGNGVHVEPESVFMIGRNMQYALIDRTGKHDLSELTSLQNWFLKYELQTVEGVSEARIQLRSAIPD